MIDQQTIDKLRNLPIERVAERLGMRVRKHKAICPFHQMVTPRAIREWDKLNGKA